MCTISFLSFKTYALYFKKSMHYIYRNVTHSFLMEDMVQYIFLTSQNFKYVPIILIIVLEKNMAS